MGDILSNNKFTLFSFGHNTSSVFEKKDDDTLNIDIRQLSLEHQKEIKKEIFDATIQTNNEIFLQNKYTTTTRDIKNFLPKNIDEDLLKFYKDKLSPDMYKALEASLVVKNAFDNKKDITTMKWDIAKKYPDFGNNLCNLTTEGYFHGHFKELYDSMVKDEDFDIVLYRTKIEKIVKSLPYIVFITQHRSLENLSEIVKFKLGKLKKYGTGKLILHGIGKNNVKTTLIILDEYAQDKNIEIKKELNEQGNIITATLYF